MYTYMQTIVHNNNINLYFIVLEFNEKKPLQFRQISFDPNCQLRKSEIDNHS